jgi:hypothetical protein
MQLKQYPDLEIIASTITTTKIYVNARNKISAPLRCASNIFAVWKEHQYIDALL